MRLCCAGVPRKPRTATVWRGPSHCSYPTRIGEICAKTTEKAIAFTFEMATNVKQPYDEKVRKILVQELSKREDGFRASDQVQGNQTVIASCSYSCSQLRIFGYMDRKAGSNLERDVIGDELTRRERKSGYCDAFNRPTRDWTERGLAGSDVIGLQAIQRTHHSPCRPFKIAIMTKLCSFYC